MGNENPIILLVLAGVVLVMLLLPLARRSDTRRAPRRDEAADADVEAEDPSLLALREIEQDRAMGKLSEADYAMLRARYEAEVQRRAPVRRSRGPAMATSGASPHRRAAGAPSAGAASPSREADEESGVGAASLEARAERLVRQWRSTAPVTCPTCGPRPEPDAAFCSRCGRTLRPCPACGAAVEQPGARYCPSCGASLTS